MHQQMLAHAPVPDRDIVVASNLWCVSNGVRAIFIISDPHASRGSATNFNVENVIANSAVIAIVIPRLNDEGGFHPSVPSRSARAACRAAIGVGRAGIYC